MVIICLKNSPGAGQAGLAAGVEQVARVAGADGLSLNFLSIVLRELILHRVSGFKRFDNS
jgi:hypothetical protein